MDKEEKNVAHIKVSGYKRELIRWQEKLAGIDGVELVKSGKNTNQKQPDSVFSEIFRKAGTKKSYFYVDAKITDIKREK